MVTGATASFTVKQGHFSTALKEQMPEDESFVAEKISGQSECSGKLPGSMLWMAERHLEVVIKQIKFNFYQM